MTLADIEAREQRGEAVIRRPVADRRNEPSEATPAKVYWLLWSAAGVGVVICALAFLLWGINGRTYLLDLMAAFCA